MADCPHDARFMIDNSQFANHKDNIRQLKLRTGGKWTAAEWLISRTGGELSPHPFHIHVNPFQVMRSEPSGSGATTKRWVWKDTQLVNSATPIVLRTRYTRFKGRFVLHCHILSHEDKGMMQIVEIID